MRTKQEEHKLIETFDQTTAAIKTDARPLFTELLKATEEYQKSLAQTAFLGTKLSDVMKRVVAISPDPEMNKGLEDVTEIFTTQEKLDEDFSKFILNSILVPMRQQHDDEKKSLPEFIKKVRAQRKASEKVCNILPSFCACFFHKRFFRFGIFFPSFFHFIFFPDVLFSLPPSLCIGCQGC